MTTAKKRTWRMPRLLALILLGSLSLALAGCGGSGSTDTSQPAAQNGPATPTQAAAADPVDTTVPPRVAVTDTRPGKVYDQVIHVTKTGDDIAITVMEPSQLAAGKSYPLVLHGHGYGGHRSHTPDAFQQRLRNHGFYVISIDQRGFGESSGNVRVMSPDYEGQDLVAVLDWAENLPGLARRDNGKMRVGSYGGSYGGMYQYILAGTDPQQRLTVIAPDIAPYDLAYSLDPQGVPKTGWAIFLATSGELPLTNLFGSDAPQVLANFLANRLNPPNLVRQDPTVLETLARGALVNHIPTTSLNFLHYHSLAYFCEGRPPLPEDGFILGQPDPEKVAASGLPKIDALLTQGFRDTLFNFNEAYHSYQCLSQLGGDVRLLTHQSGHILPLSLESIPNWDQYAGWFYDVLRLPGFQQAGGSRNCGNTNLDDVTFDWFMTKLKGKKALLTRDLPSGQLNCLSLAESDAIGVKQVTVGGTAFDIDHDTPAFSGIAGSVTSLLGRPARKLLKQTQVLYTAPASGMVLAGIPTLDVTVTSLIPGLHSCLKPAKLLRLGDLGDVVKRLLPTDDLGALGDSVDTLLGVVAGVTDILDAPALPLACDPVYFLALGKKRPKDQKWTLIDDQITPLRGFGEHHIQMNGVATRLQPGEQVALMIFGFNLQFPLSLSRDPLVIAATLNGQVKLPLLTANDIAMQGL